MPVSGQEHRIKTGLFYATNAIILEKKQKKTTGKAKYRLFDEICSWDSCFSIALLYLCFLLMLSNDVEKNPGPEQSTQLSSQTCCSHFTDHVEKRFQKMFYSLKANSAFIHYDIGSKISRVEGLISHMQHTITDLVNIAKENTNYINNLLVIQDIRLRQLNLAESEIDRLEASKRATNLKIYGLMESSDDCIVYDENDDDAFEDATNVLRTSSTADLAASVKASSDAAPVTMQQSQQPMPDSSGNKTSTEGGNQVSAHATAKNNENNSGNQNTYFNTSRRSSINTKIPTLTNSNRVKQKQTKLAKTKPTNEQTDFNADKIARPQRSQSFTAYTISKEQYDS